MGKHIMQDDSRKTKAQLLDEVQELREQVGLLESIVSKQTGVERELQAAKQKINVLFEQSDAYCMILDPNTADGIPVVVDANKAACEAHGYTRAEFIGRPISDIDNEEGRRICIERTQQILSGESLRIESTHVRKDGTIFPVAVYANRVNIEGELPLIVTSEHDITERKKAEEAQNRFFDMTLHLLLIAGYDGIIERVNPGWHEILGYNPRDITGTPFLELVHTDDHSSTIAEVEKLSQGDTTLYFENRYRTSGGSYRLIAWSAVPDVEHDIIYAIGHDITERKQVENNLIVSEKRYRALFENMAAGFVLFETIEDDKGVPVDLIIIAANKGFETTTGLKTQDVIGKRLTRVLPGIENDAADWIGTYSKVA